MNVICKINTRYSGFRGIFGCIGCNDAASRVKIMYVAFKAGLDNFRRETFRLEWQGISDDLAEVGDTAARPVDLDKHQRGNNANF